MGNLTRQAREYFRACGTRGGNERRKRLSAAQRTHIAKLAARSRWATKTAESMLLQSIRLESPTWSDPVYIEEILSDGGMKEWTTLYHLICEHPFGEIADALEHVVLSTHIYGATNLWKAILAGLRGII
ncbi:MAG: hypothetical protein A3F16_01585 [Deltaproteobacteria bacterium RIFCSPHIGHO2_12_FULL_43_9]|nr:MAG: hypothetical protein A3F16_01585 [Deltaproteobacteria bacterium RIFCSPHIGHO2_12_FULL_43_9]